MYAVIKQQLKYSKYKNIYPILKELAHYSKNLYNQGLYIIRQEFFKIQKQQIKSKNKNFFDINKELKGTENYSLLQAGCSQQILKEVDQAFKSFQALNNKGILAKLPNYQNKEGYFKICDPQPKKKN